MRLSGFQAFPGSSFFKLFLPAAYLLLWSLLLPYYRFRLYADTISYLDLAQHYLRGDWYQALNGYWAPLISWLLAPVLTTGADALLSFKVLTMLSGLLALRAADQLLQVYRVLPLVRAAMGTALVPLLAWMALQVNTPDLLSAALLLFYLAQASRLLHTLAPPAPGSEAGLPVPPEAGQPLPFPRLATFQGLRLAASPKKLAIRQALLLGALGGGAYLAKNYNFYFVLVHLLGLALWVALGKPGRGNRRRLLRPLGLALLVFGLVSACWIGPISWKYGRLTAGTAGRFNLSLAAPGSQGFPYLYQGLLPPPHAGAWQSWEDPGRYQLPAWQPWASKADLAYEASLTAHNAAKYLGMLWHYHPLVLVMVLLAGWLLLQAGPQEKRNLFLSLYGLLLYPLGYWLIYLEERHIWICVLLALVLTGQVLSLLLHQAKAWQQAVLAGLLCGMLVNQPLRDLYDHRFVNQRQFHAQARAVLAHLPLAGKRVATPTGSWHEGLFLSFFTRSRYYGATPAGLSEEEVYQSLKRYRINYFLVWGKGWPGHPRLRRVIYLKEYGLAVYAVGG